jgi:hypothetical protein
MPNIKPVSDLRNYTEVFDMNDYEKNLAMLKLTAELMKGEKSGEEQGWLSIENVETSLGNSFPRDAGNHGD